MLDAPASVGARGPRRAVGLRRALLGGGLLRSRLLLRLHRRLLVLLRLVLWARAGGWPLTNTHKYTQTLGLNTSYT